MDATSTVNQVEICQNCQAEIDPDCCGCGSSANGHGSAYYEGHSFVPAGCNCLREPSVQIEILRGTVKMLRARVSELERSQ